MNLIDSTVTEVIGEPYERFGKWWVQVRGNCWGSPCTTSLMFETKEEAEAVEPGHEFLT